MACSIDIQPEFVPSEFCGGVDYPSPLAACNQFGDYLDNETALDELWRVQGEGGRERNVFQKNASSCNEVC